MALAQFRRDLHKQASFTGKTGPQLFAGLSAAFAGFSVGCSMGWSSPCLPLIRDYLEDDDQMNAWQEELMTWISSGLSFGACVGLLIVAAMVEKIGRRRIMLGLVPFWMGGYVLLALVRSNVGWVAGRLVTGMCAGAYCVLSPLYVCETALVHLRGHLTIAFQLFLVLGISLASGLAYLHDIKRITLVMVAPLLIFAFTFLFVPETPSYLLTNGREPEARRALQRLRGPATDIRPQELYHLKLQVLERMARKWKFSDFLKVRGSGAGLRRAIGICVMLLMGQQLCGINTVVTYAQEIFEDFSLDVNAKLLSNILSNVRVVASIVAAFFVHLAGRRPMLLVSYVTVAICNFTLGTFFYLDSHGEDTNKFLWLPIATLYIYMISYAIGAGFVGWAMMAELLPSEVGGMVNCFCSIIHWAVAFLIIKTYPNISQYMGTEWSFWIYAIFTILFTVFIALFVVETNHLTILQIRNILEGNDPVHAPPGLRWINPDPPPAPPSSPSVASRSSLSMPSLPPPHSPTTDPNPA